MAGPIKVAFLADTGDLRSNLKAARESFDQTAAEAKTAGKKIGAGLDTATAGTEELADRGAQAGGALTGLGEVVGGKFGGAMVAAGGAIQIAGDAGDLFNATLRVMTLENIKARAAQVASTVSTAASGAASRAAAAATAAQAAATRGAAAVQGAYAAATNALSLSNARAAVTSVAHRVAMIATSAATKAAAAGQWLLNAAMTANPIGLVVAAIALLVAGFIYAWKNSETFRRIVTGAWTGIKTGAIAVFNFLKTFISGAFAFVKNAFLRYTPLGLIISHFGRIRSFVVGVWNAIKNGASTAWGAVTGAVRNAVGSINSTVSGIRNKVVGALTGAARWLYDSGRSIIQGLVNGIRSLISRPADLIREGLASARRLLPFSPAKEGPFSGKGWTYFSGRAVMRDMARGIQRQQSTLVSAARGAAAAASGELQLDSGVGVGGRSAVAPLIVNVTAGVGDRVAIGREVAGVLEAYRSAGGRL
ncbi:MAG: phage tail protein [Phycicoccus sp.]